MFYDALNSRVALLKLIPGASAGQLRFLLDENDAVILESFGVGGVPSGETGEFYEVIRKASAKVEDRCCYDTGAERRQRSEHI